MIIAEDRIKEVLAGMPDIVVDYDGTPTNFKHRFDYGSKEDLNIFLQQEKKIYPLIWLETGFDEDFDIDENDLSVSVSLKIATYGLNKTLLNQERLELTFKQVLLPLLENIMKTFERSNVCRIDGNNYKVKKYFNYGTGSTSETTDIWDAIKLDIDLNINEDCIIAVNYG